MPERNCETPTQPIRKSPRLLQQKSKKRRVCCSPISSSEKTHFNSPFRSIKRVNLNETHVRNSRNLLKSIDGSKSVNGVEGFQSLRRSPRFCTIVEPLELSDKRVRDSKPIRKNSKILTDVSDKEVSLVVNRKWYSEKPRKSGSGLVGSSRVLRESNVGIRSMEEGGQKKSGNARERTVVSRQKRKCSSGKENCYAQDVGKGVNGSRLNSPLTCIENIAPKTNPESNAEKIEKKLVKPLMSRTGKSDGVEGIHGVRRSTRLTALESTHAIVDGKRAAGEPDGVNGESTESSVCSEKREISLTMTPKAVGEKRRGIVKTGIKENEGKKRNDTNEGNCGCDGWTKDQELALQRAYFAAKPSPHFWKKVSKLVPGKSAQECFDKIHSDLATPPQLQPRSRAKLTNSSPLGHFSLSGSKLLEPTELNVKWPKGKKQKKLLAQKTLRHLVQKRSLVDQGYEADLFSVLEPITNIPTQEFPQTNILFTPECKIKGRGFVAECHENSLSDQKKPLSRFQKPCQTALISPPVLKQVKNRALHEKYIDQLHSREARRMGGRTKCVSAKGDMKENHVKKTNVVAVARSALVSEAKDMINKFQELQASVMNDSEDSQIGDDFDGDDIEDDDGF